MRMTVRTIAKHFPTAIISGRCCDKVCEFIGLTELYYAGSHGMDIIGPVHKSGSSTDHINSIRSTVKQGKEAILFHPASEFLPTIDETVNAMESEFKVGAKNEMYAHITFYRVFIGFNRELKRKLTTSIKKLRKAVYWLLMLL